MKTLVELEEAEKIANAILDGNTENLHFTREPNIDPDDDMHILARQFLRLMERSDIKRCRTE